MDYEKRIRANRRWSKRMRIAFWVFLIVGVAYVGIGGVFLAQGEPVGWATIVYAVAQILCAFALRYSSKSLDETAVIWEQNAADWEQITLNMEKLAERLNKW